MKKIEEAFTPEQREVLENVYVVVGDELLSFIKDGHPKKDKLQIIDDYYGFVLTADDFSRDEDGNFIYTAFDPKSHFYQEKEQYGFCRCDTPEEVVHILDAAIDEKEAAEKKAETAESEN